MMQEVKTSYISETQRPQAQLYLFHFADTFKRSFSLVRPFVICFTCNALILLLFPIAMHDCP